MRKELNWAKIKKRISEINEKITKAGLTGELNQKLIEKRTRRLMNRKPPDREEEPQIGILIFKIGKEEYALEMSCLLRINVYKDSTPVPGCTKLIDGIVSFNDSIYCVASSHELIGVEKYGEQDDNYILFLKNLDTALLVDKIQRITFYKVEDFCPLDKADSSASMRFLKGFLPDHTGILDINKIKSIFN